jgi:hypothetical protein
MIEKAHARSDSRLAQAWCRGKLDESPVTGKTPSGRSRYGKLVNWSPDRVEPDGRGLIARLISTCSYHHFRRSQQDLGGCPREVKGEKTRPL